MTTFVELMELMIHTEHVDCGVSANSPRIFEGAQLILTYRRYFVFFLFFTFAFAPRRFWLAHADQGFKHYDAPSMIPLNETVVKHLHPT